MPEALMLVHGAALAAPGLLLVLLIWTGLERLAEQHGREARVRARLAELSSRILSRRRISAAPLAAPRTGLVLTRFVAGDRDAA
jgi:hypothetical protein